MEAPSLFSTPHCLMAKDGAKVLQEDELEEFSYDDLVDMLTDVGELVIKEKKVEGFGVEVWFTPSFL